MSLQSDLETKIMGCWNIIEDIDELASYVSNDPKPELDRIINILRGMKDLYSLRFDSCFLTFEEFIREQHNKVSR